MRGHMNSALCGQFDWSRWLGVVTFGCFCSAGLYVPFYRFLDRRVGTAASLKAVGLKVLLDDAMFVPFVEIPTLCAPSLPLRPT